QIGVVQQAVVEGRAGIFHAFAVTRGHGFAHQPAQLFQLTLVGRILDFRNHVLLGLFQDLDGILVFGGVVGVLASLHQVFVDAFHLHDLAGVHLAGAGLLDREALLLASVDVVNLHGQNAVVAVFVGDFNRTIALLPG